jgi:pimeloyl-ACP methyl ester carboxylesterase
MVFVRSGDVQLHVEETGTGHPIVFVHEFASDCREWEPQVRWLSRSYRCITYNARGYPPSDVPASRDAYGWEHAVADLLAVLDGLRIEQAHLVGLSMGGYAVLQFGLRHPERASAIVAAGAGSGSGPAERATWPRVAAAIAERFLTDGIDAMADEIGHGPTRVQLRRKSPRAWEEFMAHLREHDPVGMANTMARFQAQRPSLYDFEEQFRALQVPVLLAVGDEDGPCLETNLMLKRAIPNAGLWIHPHTGHAINLEEPAAFNAMVGAFLAEVERGGAAAG